MCDLTHRDGEEAGMARYLLFAGDNFYASGGWYDLKYYNNDDDTPEALLKRAIALSVDWWHIVDTETNNILYIKKGSYCGREK